jgi:hypothetical protein
MTKSNFTSLDVEGHDGSAAGLYLGGTLVTTTAAELNKMADFETQEITSSGAITIKNGVVKLNKADAPIAATIAAPVASTDDFKQVMIYSANAQSHTVAVSAGGAFGNGGAGENLATLSGVIGDTLCIIAYQGYWYINGSHQCVVS